MASRSFCAIAAAMTVGGCASTPDVVYRYYPAKAATTVTVTQTVDCNQAKTQIVQVMTPSVATSYSSDLSKPPQSLRLKDLGGTMADTEFTMSWYDDGRLKSINQSSTGQGEAILKAAESALGALGFIGGAEKAAPAALKECDFINSWGSGKPVTIVYGHTFTFAAGEKSSARLDAIPGYQPLFDQIGGLLPILQASVGMIAPPSVSLVERADASPTDSAVMLHLYKTAYVAIEITAKSNPIWKGTVTVPTAQDNPLPIPKSALFGKQAFALSLAETGAVTSVTYNKTSGAASAFNAVTALDSALSPASDAAKAAAIKAQADLIAQQQRLVRCQAQPDKCV